LTGPAGVEDADAYSMKKKLLGDASGGMLGNLGP
jgi:hypothetical protein